MNIHHLELFYHVARHRGISAAARRMSYGIQQPAISGQLSQLEKTLGLTLFHRRPFGLTAAGTKLFNEIEPFFAGLKELPAHVRGQANQRLRLAAPARILRDYLPRILAKYKRRYVDFALTLYDVNQGDAEELLRRREIDIAITELEGRPTTGITACDLVRLPLVMVVPRLSKVRNFTALFRDGRPIEKLISLPPHEVISKHFQTNLKKLSCRWPTTIEVSSLDLIDIYTSLGFGVGVSVFVPGRKIVPGLRLLPMPKFPPLTIAALWMGELAPVAQSFLSDVKEIAARINVALRRPRQFN
jgi:DNA-binding transcriptional LysR family regulator